MFKSNQYTDTFILFVHAGIQVCTPKGLYTCREMLLACSVDLPTRALVTNMNHFNGPYSCCTCEDKGDNTVGSTLLHRVWPYSSSNVVRSNVHATIKEATVEGKTVRFKGQFGTLG